MKRILKTGAVLLISAMVALALASCDTGGGSGPSNNARLRASDVRIGGNIVYGTVGAGNFYDAIENASAIISIGGAAGTIDFSNVLADHRDATLEFIALTPPAYPEVWRRPSLADRYSLYFMALSTDDFGILAIPGAKSYIVIRVTAQNGTTVRYYAWRIQVGAGPGPLPRLGTLTIGGVGASAVGFGQGDAAVGTGSVVLGADTALPRRGAITLTMEQVLSQSLTVTATGAQITGYFVAPGDRATIIPTGMVGAEWEEVTRTSSFTTGLSDLVHLGAAAFDFATMSFLPPPATYLFIRTESEDGREWFYRLAVTVTGRPVTTAPATGQPDLRVRISDPDGATVTLGTGSSTADVPLLEGTAGRRGSVTLTPAQAQNLTAASFTGLPASSVITGLAVGNLSSPGFCVETDTVLQPNWVTAPISLSPGPHHLFIRTTVSGRTWYYRIAVTVTQPAVALDLEINGVAVTAADLGIGGTPVNVVAANRGAITLTGAQPENLVIRNTGYGAEIQVAVGTASTTAVNIRAWISNPHNPKEITLEGVTLNDQAHLFIRTRDNFQAAFFHHRIVVSVPGRERAISIGDVAVTEIGTGHVAAALALPPAGSPPGTPPGGGIPATPAAGVLGAITLSSAQAANPGLFTSSYLGGDITGLHIWRNVGVRNAQGDLIEDADGNPIPTHMPSPFTTWLPTPHPTIGEAMPTPTLALALEALAQTLGEETATLEDGDHLFIRLTVPGLVAPGTFPAEHTHFYRIVVTVE